MNIQCNMLHSCVQCNEIFALFVGNFPFSTSQVRTELMLWSGLENSHLRENLKKFASALLGRQHRHLSCRCCV